MPTPKWTSEAARSVLEVAGFDVVSEERTKDGYGTAMRSADGALVVVYDSGKVLCQGKRMADTKSLFTGIPPHVWSPPPQLPRTIAASPTPTSAVMSAAPVPMPSSKSVRFVRDIPAPGGVGDIDLPW